MQMLITQLVTIDFVYRLLKGDYCLESDMVDPILANKNMNDRRIRSLSSDVFDIYKQSLSVCDEEEERKYFSSEINWVVKFATFYFWYCWGQFRYKIEILCNYWVRLYFCFYSKFELRRRKGNKGMPWVSFSLASLLKRAFKDSFRKGLKEIIEFIQSSQIGGKNIYFVKTSQKKSYKKNGVNYITVFLWNKEYISGPIQRKSVLLVIQSRVSHLERMFSFHHWRWSKCILLFLTSFSNYRLVRQREQFQNYLTNVLRYFVQIFSNSFFSYFV